MSEPENFVTRWSRRKRKAADDEARTIAPAAPQTRDTSPCKEEVDFRERSERQSEEGLRQGSPANPVEPSASFDLAKLPPIDSITAETDIRAFLAPGVPPELTRAALRRAWTADPAIRDFIGLSENSWDFNAPDAIAGFGPLEMTDELRREIVRLVGRNIVKAAGDAASSSEDAKEAASPIERAALSDATGCSEHSQDAGKPGDPEPAAAELVETPQPAIKGKQPPDPAPPMKRRAHGGALPQ